MFVNTLAAHQIPHVQRRRNREKYKRTQRGAEMKRVNGRKNKFLFRDNSLQFWVELTYWGKNKSFKTCTLFNVKHLEPQQVKVLK